MNEIVIIPNPFNTSFTLNNKTEINEVIITDLSGKNVYVNKPNNKKHGIDGSSLLPGLYIIKCRLGNSWSVNKVIKQ